MHHPHPPGLPQLEDPSGHPAHPAISRPWAPVPSPSPQGTRSPWLCSSRGASAPGSSPALSDALTPQGSRCTSRTPNAPSPHPPLVPRPHPALPELSRPVPVPPPGSGTGTAPRSPRRPFRRSPLSAAASLRAGPARCRWRRCRARPAPPDLFPGPDSRCPRRPARITRWRHERAGRGAHPEHRGSPAGDPGPVSLGGGRCQPMPRCSSLCSSLCQTLSK